MPARPRIAIDARLVGGTSTGDSTYWTGLIHGLSRLELDAEFLLYSNAPAPSFIPDRMRWVEVPGRNGRLWSLLQFPARARRDHCNVFHVQYSLSPLLRRGGITTIHDVSFLIGPEWFRPRDRLLLTASCRAGAKWARKILTVSETSKRDIARLLPANPDKIAVIPLAPGLGIQRLDREEALGEASALGIAPPFLLTVGTRWPRKNMSLAVRAVEQSKGGSPLVVTGKQGWGEEAASGRVINTGYVSDRQLSALYSLADLYLAPSHYEGFGITLLEAFACGCPVLCSSGGAHPEVAGDAAEVMDSWDPGDWADRIDALLSGNLAQMRERGLRRVRRFSWEDMARRTAEAYFEVAG